ncbi:MAG TPA: YraN family protein [Clostridiales bacterium]|jgi:putative endonuclease|nr:YraN family protein [Clostridiales bacterium]
MKKQNLQKGKIGEAKAVYHLKKTGYTIIQTNFRCSIGEIDIIAQDNGVLAFVEVKSRKDTAYGYPSEAIGYKKRQNIAKVAITYIKQNNLFDMPVRFDVVEIIGDEINLIKDAFSSNIRY